MTKPNISVAECVAWLESVARTNSGMGWERSANLAIAAAAHLSRLEGEGLCDEPSRGQDDDADMPVYMLPLDCPHCHALILTPLAYIAKADAILAHLSRLEGEGPSCVACEDKPKAPNNPCAVCGLSSPRASPNPPETET